MSQAVKSNKTNGTSSTSQPRQKSVNLSMQPVNDVVEYAKQYAREKPEVAAMWCFGLGFFVGWKIKPW